MSLHVTICSACVVYIDSSWPGLTSAGQSRRVGPGGPGQGGQSGAGALQGRSVSSGTIVSHDHFGKAFVKSPLVVFFCNEVQQK